MDCIASEAPPRQPPRRGRGRPRKNPDEKLPREQRLAYQREYMRVRYADPEWRAAYLARARARYRDSRNPSPESSSSDE